MPTPQSSDARQQAALALLCSAQFMVVLDATIVAVALSNMQSDLGLSPQNLQWVINAYTLLFGGFLLLGGRAADLFGRKRVFRLGITLFSLASLMGGLSPSGNVLTLARSLQGLGGAMISPAALSILTTLFTEGGARNRALGIWGATAAAGSTSGVLLGGLLTNYLGWRSVLFVNVPIGLITVLLSSKLLKGNSQKDRLRQQTDDNSPSKGFDLAGAIAITSGLMVFVYAIVGITEFGWNSTQTLSLLAISLLLIASFIWIELRSKSPLVKFSIFRLPNLTGANLVALVHASGPLSTLFFISLYLQQVLGYSALATGLAFVPFSLCAAAAAIFAAPTVQRFGLKATIAGGLLMMAFGLLLFSQLPPNGNFWLHVLPGSILVGGGITLAGVPMTIAAMSGVEERDAGLASGLINTSQQIGAAIVLALLVTLSSSQTQAILAIQGNSEAAIAIALTKGFQVAFLVGAGLLIAGVITALLLIKNPTSHNPN
jgi:EmrB/QacA subfamily drug resistance transporter